MARKHLADGQAGGPEIKAGLVHDSEAAGVADTADSTGIVTA